MVSLPTCRANARPVNTKPGKLGAIPRAYADILFLDHVGLGLLVMAATFWYPNIGLAGLLGAVTGLLTARIFRFAESGSALQIYNSLLVGLSLGAFYEVNLYLVVLIVLGAVLAVLASVVIADSLWRLDRLPALSLPFIIVVLFTTPVARRYSSLSDYMGLADAHGVLLSPAIDGFFSSLGSTFFSPQPWVGILLFIAIFLRSRYLAFLAIIGYAFGYGVFMLLTDNPPAGLMVWTGFTYILTAMAIAGIYTVPGIQSTALALLTVALTVLLVIATQNLLLVDGLPVMAIPFVITVVVVLSALAKRGVQGKPWLAPMPALPEVNYERARLAQVRNGEFDSIPVLMPVYGEWEIYQGFDGQHTHQDRWRHALDFYMTEQGRSYRGEGQKLEDFYCFGLPVVSPVHGKVVRAIDKLADNMPGEVDVKNNWGNILLLRMENGLHVLLAHLQQGSIKVREGDWVTPGTVLADCGNSGRSPQPHLHMQVQEEAQLGSATHPFHLTSVLLRNKDEKLEYRLVARPAEGERVQAASEDERLYNAMHLPVGRSLRYRVCINGGAEQEIELHVTLTLLGQFRLQSSSGASAAFEEINGVLAFFDRQGPGDLLLDSWLLANGLTPLADQAHRWRDAPSANLLPLPVTQRLLLWLIRPLGCGLDSVYWREWDAEYGKWCQHGEHRLKINGRQFQASTESIINPVYGCTHIELIFPSTRLTAELLDTGAVEDQGVPGWKQDVSFLSSLP